MQLSATKIAQFFVQDEFSKIEVIDDSIELTSLSATLCIPFSYWSGKIEYQRGVLWTTLSIYGYKAEIDKTEAGTHVWKVQGLPWEACQSFAAQLVHNYEKWHNNLCRKLNLYSPKWLEKIELIQNKPGFVRHSELQTWRDMLARDLTEANIAFEEAEKRLPTLVATLKPWIESSKLLNERNDNWLNVELENWQVLFAQIESSPLNRSQQKAILLNDDHNLILAGAGTGKTSVITARVAYSLQSRQVDAEQILVLAFGKQAANEMRERINKKLGSAGDGVQVSTFHQLAMRIIREVHQHEPQITPLATNASLKKAWLTQWLKEHWINSASFKRWQTHLKQWPIAFLSGDDELGAQSENPKLLGWLEQQIEQLCAIATTKKNIQESLVKSSDYPRLNSELQLVWPCYQAWNQMLKDEGSLDFYSMISLATKYLTNGRFIPTWRRIMVDEYQDISPDRLDLLKALSSSKKQDSHPSVFAVGDDWQSIYQFAGSEVNLTIDFKTLFPNATVHALDRTYRFNDRIAKVANQFVLQNPSQLHKELISNSQSENCCVSILEDQQLEEALSKLNSDNPLRTKVLLLGRNNHHKPKKLKTWQGQYTHLNLEFLTCHSSKGQEADYTFVLACNDKEFPAKVRTKHLKEFLSSNEESIEFAEERRLFYVALTRARKHVYLVHGNSPSVFINELIEGNYDVEVWH